MISKRLGFRLGLIKRAAGEATDTGGVGTNTRGPKPKIAPKSHYPYNVSQPVVSYAKDLYSNMGARPAGLFMQPGNNPQLRAASNIVKPENLGGMINRSTTGWSGGRGIGGTKVINTPARHKNTPLKDMPPIVTGHEYTHADTPQRVNLWAKKENAGKFVSNLFGSMTGEKQPEGIDNTEAFTELAPLMAERAISLRGKLAAQPNRPAGVIQQEAAKSAPLGLSAGELGQLNQYMPQFGTKDYAKNIYQLMARPEAERWAKTRRAREMGRFGGNSPAQTLQAQLEHTGIRSPGSYAAPKDTFEADKADILRQLKENQ